MNTVEVKPSLPINPLMLAWARDWAGMSEEDAAKKVNKSADNIKEWALV